MLRELNQEHFFGFTAIAFGLVGYVTTLFKLSAVLTILWARVFLYEDRIRERLLEQVSCSLVVSSSPHRYS